MDWRKAIINWLVQLGEQSSPKAINRNTDGQGLSFGILQWTEKSLELALLLERALTSFPLEMAQVFGPRVKALVLHARQRPLQPFEGAHLWQSPWVERFAAAGATAWMGVVQTNHALSGFHWLQAMKAADVLGARTDRAIALVFDRAVVAPGRVPKSAQAAMEQAPDAPEMERVALFAGIELSHIDDQWRPQHLARVHRYMDAQGFTDQPVRDVAAA